MRDLEINLLRTLVAVTENGSFTAAGLAIGRSQSAVSQKIMRLEKAIGQRVFDRNSRSMTLTLAGERLLAAARAIVDANDRLIHSLDEPSAAGLLRLGISDDFLPGQLHRLLARFARLYPGVEIALTTGLSCDLLDAYDEGRMDAVIAKKNAAIQDGRVIWREPLLWMASTGYPAHEEGIARLVMLPKPCSYREQMIETLGKAGRDWTIACSASSLWGVRAAVAGGLGIAALGQSFLTNDMQVLTDSCRWPSLPPMEIVVVSEETRSSDLVRALLSFLSESLTANHQQGGYIPDTTD